MTSSRHAGTSLVSARLAEESVGQSRISSGSRKTCRSPWRRGCPAVSLTGAVVESPPHEAEQRAGQTPAEDGRQATGGHGQLCPDLGGPLMGGKESMMVTEGTATKTDKNYND